MAGTLKIGGNTIATHAGSEGEGTVTLDSSTLTIGSNVSLTSATFPSGHIIQTVQYLETASYTMTYNVSSGWVKLTNGSGVDFAVTITTKVANSKIMVGIYIGQSVAHTGVGYGGGARLVREVGGSGTNIGLNTGSGTPKGTFSMCSDNPTYGDRPVSFVFLDSPNASVGTAIKYYITLLSHTTGNHTFLMNRNNSYTTSGTTGSQTVNSSTFIAQEIAP